MISVASGDGPAERFVKLFDAVGDGGVWSTLADLRRWDRALRERAVLPAAAWAHMLERGRLTDGEETRYAGGLIHGDYRDRPTIEHGGFMLGFRHQYVRLVRSDIAVILLTADRSIDDRALRDALLDAIVGAPAPDAEKTDERAPAPSPPSAPPADLGAIPGDLAGCWLSPEVPVALTVRARAGELRIEPPAFREIALARVGERSFTAFGGTMKLSFPSHKKMILSHADLGDLAFHRVDAIACAGH